MWSLLSFIGVAVTYFCPWTPQSPSFTWSLYLRGFGRSGKGCLCLQANVRIRIMDRRCRQLSLRLDSFTALSIFLIAFWEPKSGFSWPLFIPVGLGKACFLPSLTNPAQRGQDGTTSFGKLAPSRSIESRFLSDQASSLKVSGNPDPSIPQLLSQGSPHPHPATPAQSSPPGRPPSAVCMSKSFERWR